MNGTRVRPRFLLALLLCLAFSTQWSLRAGFWEATVLEQPRESLGDLVLDAIPEQVRHLGADFLWLRADEYMHFGPSRRLPSTFLAGSYAANTEIIPLLEMAIRLNPRHFDAYAILSQNLALYLDRFTDGIRLLQSGILANRGHPRVHELYWTIAYCYGFVQGYGGKQVNDRGIALGYLDRAVEAYDRAGSTVVSGDDLLKRENYQVLRARFLVELGRRDEALAAWRASGLDLNLAGGLLAEYLRRYGAGLPVPTLPEDLLQEAAVASAVGGAQSQGSTGPGGGSPRMFPEGQPIPEKPGEHGHGQDQACNHTGEACQHAEPGPGLLEQAKAWRGILAQMVLLGGVGLFLLARSRA